MKQQKSIIVAGEGHLSFQLIRKLRAEGYNPVKVPIADGKGGELSSYERAQEAFEAAGISAAEAVFLVDDEDERNIQSFLIVASRNKVARLFVSLFNQSLASNLASAHPALTLFSPATLAASTFADSVEHTPPLAALRSAVPPPQERWTYSPGFLHFFTVTFFAIFAAASVYFHFKEQLSWFDAVYFTATTITTTGFGDVSMLHANAASKALTILLMFGGISLISISFSLIVDALLTRRTERQLGRKQYRLRDHIVVCGLGRLGLQTALELLHRGYRVLVIERTMEDRFAELLRAEGGLLFVGDASFSRTLRRANVEHARALISAIDDDMKNLEIGLTARSLRPDLALVLRIFDKDIAEDIRRTLPVRVALSTSAIVAAKLVERL